MRTSLDIDIAMKAFAGGIIPSDVQLMVNLKDCIEQHYTEQREQEFYCGRLCLSKKQLNRLTGSYYGKTVHELVQDRIHLEVEKMLRYTGISVKEISLVLGICDQGYLCRCFKKRTGKGPKEWREMIRENLT